MNTDNASASASEAEGLTTTSHSLPLFIPAQGRATAALGQREHGREGSPQGGRRGWGSPGGGAYLAYRWYSRARVTPAAAPRRDTRARLALRKASSRKVHASSNLGTPSAAQPKQGSTSLAFDLNARPAGRALRVSFAEAAGRHVQGAQTGGRCTQFPALRRYPQTTQAFFAPTLGTSLAPPPSPAASSCAVF